MWFQNRRTKHKRTEQEEEAKKKSGGAAASQQGESAGAASWRDDEDADRSGSPASAHRPVDLSSHDDSSESEA